MELAHLRDDKLADQQQWLSMLVSHRDPLDDWYQLVRFIAVAKRDKLKGTAQFAQVLYSIEHMLRLFAKDACGLDLHPPHASPTWTHTDAYGKDVAKGSLQHLELVVNDYHLNPRPKLVLVVEGRGEETVIPQIAEQALGHSFAAHRGSAHGADMRSRRAKLRRRSVHTTEVLEILWRASIARKPTTSTRSPAFALSVRFSSRT